MFTRVELCQRGLYLAAGRLHTDACFFVSAFATVQDYEQAIQLQPNSTEVLYRKGQVLEAMKRPKV